MSGKFTVWKHDCIKHGEGSWPDDTVRACDPPCEDPWQVDAPTHALECGIYGETFTTHAEAIAYADKITREHA